MDLTVVVLAYFITWIGIAMIIADRDDPGKGFLFLKGLLIMLFSISSLITLIVAVKLIWNLAGRVVE